MNNNVNAIKAIIDEATAMRNAYFFHSPINAGSRRSYEKYHSHDMVEWEDNGHTYTAKYTVSCSCANVYAKGEYTKDGKPTTLTAIKASYKRLSAQS